MHCSILSALRQKIDSQCSSGAKLPACMFLLCCYVTANCFLPPFLASVEMDTVTKAMARLHVPMYPSQQSRLSLQWSVVVLRIDCHVARYDETLVLNH